MDIMPVRSEVDYGAALERIDRLMGATPGTPDGDRLEDLVTLVEAYEAHRRPVEAPDPVAMIEHAMEARGYRHKNLAAVIGSQSHTSEVLSRRRPLTLPMIRALSAKWIIPADVLVSSERQRMPFVVAACPRSRRRPRGLQVPPPTAGLAGHAGCRGRR